MWLVCTYGNGRMLNRETNYKDGGSKMPFLSTFCAVLTRISWSGTAVVRKILQPCYLPLLLLPSSYPSRISCLHHHWNTLFFSADMALDSWKGWIHFNLGVWGMTILVWLSLLIQPPYSIVLTDVLLQYSGSWMFQLKTTGGGTGLAALTEGAFRHTSGKWRPRANCQGSYWGQLPFNTVLKHSTSCTTGPSFF